MIRFLKGIVEELAEDALALDVNGVGYQVFATARTLSHLAVGEVTKIHIHTHVREDQFTLYGFLDASEREMFTRLIGVNGVGMKVALAILSALGPSEILDAITMQDGKTIARANGVGPKLGERVVRELKDKVGSLPDGTSGTVVRAPVGGVAADVLSALENLGYKPTQARQALQQAKEKNEALLASGFDGLFKAALVELRK